MLALLLVFTVSGCETAKNVIRQAAAFEIGGPALYQGIPENPDDVIFRSWAQVCYEGPAGSLKELIENSDAVIYGEVTDVGFMESDLLINTVASIRVIEPLYGNYSAGNVRIIKEGGYLPADVYYGIHGVNENTVDESGRKIMDYSDEELKTKYVSYEPDGFICLKPGDKGIYFLTKTNVIKDGYWITSAPFDGEYLENQDHQFYVYLMKEDPADPEGNAFFTFEQVKEAVQNAIH